MFDRLWLRLLLGMGLALALAVGTIAALSNRATSESFAEYVEDVSAARAARAESVLSRHYQRQQGWAGVEPIIQLIADFSGQRVVLADGNGVVVADSQRRLVGQYVQPDWAGDPVIITHQERPVGSVYLDPLRPANRPDTRGLTFLAAANQYLLWAAAVGLLAALIASLLLARWLAAPLEALTRAARRMEHGDLSQAIEVRIGGEVGELARAFNATAASLNRLQQLRKQMVADIAHELRTPLTNIRGYLEAIQDGVAEPDEATLGILEHELTQLTRLVDDLQELALVEAGGLTLDRQEVDPVAVVSRGVLALRPQADALGIDLRARIASDLPRMSADGGRLEQALANVLRNALAHTPRGGAVTVTVGLDGDESAGVWDRGSVGGGRESAHALHIVVRDTGTGIAAEDLPHIFERFYRGDRSRARKGLGGYGLGLTITRELIQAHGGQIGVSSVLGRGTEFTIRLPLAPPEPSSTEEPTVEPVRAAPPRPAGRLVLPRTGALVGALFGALAGLIETGLAVAARRTQSFVDLFGYAVLIDALAFGLLGGLAAGLAMLAGRALGRRLNVSQLIATWTPAGFLLVGLLVHIRWSQLFSREEAPSPQALFAQVVILGLAAWLALLAWALLAPRRGAARRAVHFGRRLAPLTLGVLLSLSGISVAFNLGRGFAMGGTSPMPSLNPSVIGQVAPTAGPAPAAVGSPVPGAPRATATTSLAPGGPAAGAEPAPTVAVGARAVTPAAVPPRGPNVLLVTIDSLRADHVGAYGNPRVRTPSLDALAAEGVRFSAAVANQPNGTPAHATIFAGVYPATHGVRTPMVDLLPADLPTLAETLAERGYATAGIFSWLSYEPAYSGLERGFQVYSDLTVNRPSYLADSRTSTLMATYRRLTSLLALPGAMEPRAAFSDEVAEQLDGKADVTSAGAAGWLAEHRDRARLTGQPFFLWLHYFDPHYPYTPPPPHDQVEPDGCGDCPDGGLETIRRLRSDPNPDLRPAEVNRLLQHYDGEIAFTDQQFGRLLEFLRRNGLDQNTLVIVVGDHGESFGEKGHWIHGASLHDAEVHIPLLMRFPGRLPAGRVVDAVAQQVDLAPTILDLLGYPAPARAEGRSLVPLVHDREDGADRFAVAEVGSRAVVSIVTRDWRLLQNTESGAVELYRAHDDPDSLRDLADAEPEVVAELSRLLNRWRSEHP